MPALLKKTTRHPDKKESSWDEVVRRYDRRVVVSLLAMGIVVGFGSFGDCDTADAGIVVKLIGISGSGNFVVFGFNFIVAGELAIRIVSFGRPINGTAQEKIVLAGVLRWAHVRTCVQVEQRSVCTLCIVFSPFPFVRFSGIVLTAGSGCFST